MNNFILVLFVSLVAFLGLKIKSAFFTIPPKPVLQNTWWGPGSSPGTEDTDVKPFKIHVTDEVLLDLKNRLNQHRPLTPPLEGVQQQYGINSRVVNKIVDHWKNKYDWKKRESFLNKYDQYKTKIQGLDIHFLHVKPKIPLPKGVSVIPLLLVHGWPGSVREFYEILPMLTTPIDGQNFVFEVIAPSIPGYGFSEAAAKPGLGPTQVAVIFKNLMVRLGFPKYYAQGGDWGSVIISNMAAVFPEHVLGIHTNMPVARSPWLTLKQVLGSFYPSWVVDKENEHKWYPMKDFVNSILAETGYLHIQATKPDTIGVALNDSPVGLAAYILEKFISWTDYLWIKREDGGLERKFNMDDLLDNVMIYWITESITTSMRLYAESFTEENRDMNMEAVPIEVPTACAFFKNEFYFIPLNIVSDRYKNIIQASYLPDGGHFAAMEVPRLLADDVWSAVGKIEQFHKQNVK